MPNAPAAKRIFKNTRMNPFRSRYNGNNMTLGQALVNYINGNKTNANKNTVSKALQVYINGKAKGGVPGAVNKAGGNINTGTAAKIATESTPPSASPSTAGNNAATAVRQAGGNANQQAAAAAAAAQQQARQQGQGPSTAQNEAAEAAAAAAQQARPNATPTQQSQTAAAGAAAANVNTKLAALKTLLNTFNGKNNTWYANNSRSLTNLNKQLNNASRNVTLNNNTRVRLNTVKRRIANATAQKSGLESNKKGPLIVARNNKVGNIYAKSNAANANKYGKLGNTYRKLGQTGFMTKNIYNWNANTGNFQIRKN